MAARCRWCCPFCLAFLLAAAWLYDLARRSLVEANSPEHLGWFLGFLRHEWLAGLPWTATITCEPSDNSLADRVDWIMMLTSTFRFVGGCSEPDEATPWVDVRRVKDPRTVWAAPHDVGRLLDAAEEHFDPGRDDRVVIFSGGEMPLSAAFGPSEAEANATVSRLRRYFRRIVYPTKDIQLEHVHAGPMGLSFGYFLPVIIEFGDPLKGWVPLPGLSLWQGWLIRRRLSRLWAAVESIRLEDKQPKILAAWGKVASWLDSIYIIHQLPYREAVGKLWPPSNSSLRAIEHAHQSRRQLRAWANTPAARAVGLERRNFRPSEFWLQMSRYRFLLNPIGSNIQTAKTIEALLVLTVPITKRPGEIRLHDELLDMGFPLVLVDDWRDITVNRTAAWWSELSPRLHSFRRNCLTADSFWRMYMGELPRCE